MACARGSSDVLTPTERRTTRLLPLAGALAVAVLVLHPEGIIGWFVMAPALLTLACAGTRMVVALREAQGAAEAVRLSRTDELTGLPDRRAMMAAADDALRGAAPLGLVRLDLKDEVRLFEIAEQVRRVLRDPLRVDGMDLSIDASVGITVREPGDDRADDDADRACAGPAIGRPGRRGCRDPNDVALHGVDVFQGHHIAKPMPAHAVGAWVRRWSGQLSGVH